MGIIEEENAALRLQINVLWKALEAVCVMTNHGPIYKVAEAALATIPEQSLAEYRNKAITEFVQQFSRHVGGDGEFWLHELQDFTGK